MVFLQKVHMFPLIVKITLPYEVISITFQIYRLHTKFEISFADRFFQDPVVVTKLKTKYLLCFLFRFPKPYLFFAAGP